VFALCAEGGEEAGSQNGASAWQGVKQGEVGMALGVWRNGVVEGVDGLPGDAELADKSLSQEDSGGDDALIRGQWGGALDGLDALGDAVGIAHMRDTAEALEGGVARQRGGFEGRPCGEEIAADGGVFVMEPLQDVREVILQGTAKGIREAHVVADQPAAMVDKLFTGAHRGALGREGREFVAMLEQELKLEFRGRGLVLGGAGRKASRYLAGVRGLTGTRMRHAY
jgi:hypothetical protein